jgi:hypothetical protein
MGYVSGGLMSDLVFNGGEFSKMQEQLWCLNLR